MKSILTALLFSLTIASVQAQTVGGYAGSAPNVELRISIDGRIILGEPDLLKMAATDNLDLKDNVIEKNAIPLEIGKSVQLKVELVEPNGIRNDVTAHPAMFYDPISDRSLSVTKEGLVTALPSTRSYDWGELFLVYNTPQKSGYNRIFFDIKPAVTSPANR